MLGRLRSVLGLWFHFVKYQGVFCKMAGPWLIVAIQTPDPTAGSCARRGHALSSRYWPRIVGSDLLGHVSSQVGYSAPTQSGIIDEVGLSISEFAIFGSILTIGAMIGAVTSGRLADFLGRKMTMRISATICMFGWLSIHLAKSAIMLYFGRILLGFSTGVLSYVVCTSCISELDALHCLLNPISDPYQYQFCHLCFNLDNLQF